mmetsp:Transcript_9169/g.22932  ORF Transcript_9169/g.22932 Transcript_9169/m.22932 type:complete len:210 (+) Transcript_9169:706-1335(+)
MPNVPLTSSHRCRVKNCFVDTECVNPACNAASMFSLLSSKNKTPDAAAGTSPGGTFNNLEVSDLSCGTLPPCTTKPSLVPCCDGVEMFSRVKTPGPTARSMYPWITSYIPKDAIAISMPLSNARPTNALKNSRSATSSSRFLKGTSRGAILSLHEWMFRIVRSKSNTIRFIEVDVDAGEPPRRSMVTNRRPLGLKRASEKSRLWGETVS